MLFPSAQGKRAQWEHGSLQPPASQFPLSPSQGVGQPPETGCEEKARGVDDGCLTEGRREGLLQAPTALIPARKESGPITASTAPSGPRSQKPRLVRCHGPELASSKNVETQPPVNPRNRATRAGPGSNFLRQTLSGRNDQGLKRNHLQSKAEATGQLGVVERAWLSSPTQGLKSIPLLTSIANQIPHLL